ncbi:MAG: hypothetical protein PHU14_10050, partial [Methylovulum sp.]|nr:hypothetical protein [Methylovulum sp.]
MQMYLSMIQNTLGGLAGLGVAGILIAGLLCLSVRARYRGQLLKQGQDLAQAQLAHSQLSADMAQAKEAALVSLSALNAALAIDCDAPADMAGDIWQHQAELLSLLIGRVQEQDGQLAQAAADLAGQQVLAAADAAKLQSKIRSQKAYIAKLEMGRLKVFDDLNQSVQRLRQSALALAERSQAALASDRLSAENQAYKAAIAKLRWDRLKEFDELNAAIYRLHQVEAAWRGQLVTSQEAALQLRADITGYQATIAQLEAERQQADETLALAMADNQALMDAAVAKASESEAPVPLSSPAPVLAAAPVAVADAETDVAEMTAQAHPSANELVAALDSVAEPESAPEPEPEQSEPTPQAQPLFAKFMKGIKVDINLGKAKAPDEEPVSGPTPVLAGG